jgi:hypothetical protein
VYKLWIAGISWALSALIFWAPQGLQAQVVIAPATPEIGSSNTVSAEPLVARPRTTPCTVLLFTNQAFADFNTKNFNYTPPANCPGPWAKVVLTADFTVTAGRQYDRTAQFYLGGANIYFGTTAEPRAGLSPSWHVERDVTDLSALFKSAQAGTAILYNFVGVYNGVTYDGIIYANAHLEFYPASFGDRASRAPDVVIGMPGNSGAANLNTTADQLSQTLTLPTNVESAYLDVIAQAQSSDEFWYLCVPTDLTGPLQSCGNTGFRETEVTIDGQPAGVAPVYPWIYTGGVDPYLWEPIPGVQTLNFKPYRVDLTPFAGVLSNGQPHTVALSVFNASSYFSVTANLLLYTDHAAQQVTGAIVNNTLTPSPTPIVSANVTVDENGNANGPISVTAKRNYSITGYTNTSHGRVETTVSQRIAFSNTQNFTIDAMSYEQDLKQSTTGTARTITRESRRVTEQEQTFSYPVSLNYNQTMNTDGSFVVHSTYDQRYLDNSAGSHISNRVTSQNTSNYTPQGSRTSHAGDSSQRYLSIDSRGHCYSRSFTSVDSVLTAYQDGEACHGEGHF